MKRKIIGIILVVMLIASSGFVLPVQAGTSTPTTTPSTPNDGVSIVNVILFVQLGICILIVVVVVIHDRRRKKKQ